MAPSGKREALMATGVLFAGVSLWATPTNPRYQVGFSDAPAESLLSSDGEAWIEASAIAWGHRDYRTRLWGLWTGQGLALRFVAQDPSPWFTMERRDDELWNEEVVEIFLDLDASGTNYAEYELNPNNTLCDLRMIRGIPDIEGDIAWDHRGAQHRVWLHREEDRIVGWEARLFLPWEGFQSLPSSAGRRYPPRPGESFRFNVFRIERPGGPADPRLDVLFMPYIPTGHESFHVPAVFHELVFIE